MNDYIYHLNAPIILWNIIKIYTKWNYTEILLYASWYADLEWYPPSSSTTHLPAVTLSTRHWDAKNWIFNIIESTKSVNNNSIYENTHTHSLIHTIYIYMNNNMVQICITSEFCCSSLQCSYTALRIRRNVNNTA